MMLLLSAPVQTVPSFTDSAEVQSVLWGMITEWTSATFQTYWPEKGPAAWGLYLPSAQRCTLSLIHWFVLKGFLEEGFNEGEGQDWDVSSFWVRMNKLQSLMSCSVRLAQLIPPRVSTRGRRHSAVLGSALCCRPHQHPSDLGRQKTGDWSYDQVLWALCSAALIQVARGIR